MTPCSVKRLRVVCGTEGPQEAELTLTIDGVDHSIDATGDGPVDAAFNAVKMLYPHKAQLQLYQVSAVTEGTDAQATVSVRIEEDGRIATGSIGRHRYHRRIGQGLCECAEPADPAAAEIRPGFGPEVGKLQGRVVEFGSQPRGQINGIPRLPIDRLTLIISAAASVDSRQTKKNRNVSSILT